MNYKFFLNPKSTPQNQPIPGRDMVQGASGGYLFKADIWQSLRRCLLIGTAQSTYYTGKHSLTNDFVQVLQEAIALDPTRVAQEIAYASDGRAINNSAPILALVILSMSDSHAAKQAFQLTFSLVVRTGSHFYEWLSYTKSMRGFGKVIRQAGQAWLSRQDVQGLAYQLLKYQQRQGFSNRDALRLFHVKPVSADHAALYQWVVNGWDQLPKKSETPDALQQIWWYEWLKRNPKQCGEAIAQGRLTHEMAAPVGNMDVRAWQFLFNDMPMGALLRNLGSLTEIGVLRVDGEKNLNHVAQVLTSKERLRQGRIHPIDVLKALKTYQSGGQLGQSRKTWVPIPRIVDILETALERSFDALPPTGKLFLHAIDVSGSMSAYTVSFIGLTCCEIATVMALATAKAERNYLIRGFATQFRDLGITAADSFRSAMQKAQSHNFGATDASVAFDWLIKQRIKVSVICFWTDCESFAGRRHPSQAFAEYRSKVNPDAKAVYVTLVPNQITLADPNDSHSWNMAGFDPGAPRLIQMLASGEL